MILATFAIQAHDASIALVAVAVIELVTMLSVVLRVGQGMPPRPREGRTWPRIARETWSTDILQERSYVWLLTSRLFFLTAGGILFNLAIKYMAEVHGLSEHDAAGTVRNVSIIIVGAIVIVSIPAGRLSDRFGRKPVIYASCGVGMVSMVVAALAPSLPGRVPRRAPVRHRGRHVRGRRLGPDDRHHPAGVLGPVHGPVQRRDGDLGAALGRDRRRPRRRGEPVGRDGDRHARCRCWSPSACTRSRRSRSVRSSSRRGRGRPIAKPELTPAG